MAYLIDFCLTAFPVANSHWTAFEAAKGDTLEAFSKLAEKVGLIETGAKGPWLNIYSSRPSPVTTGGAQAFEDKKTVVSNALSAKGTPAGATILPLPATPTWTTSGSRHIVHSAVLDNSKNKYTQTVQMMAGGTTYTLTCYVLVTAKYTNLE